jgi:hypothetical protein
MAILALYSRRFNDCYLVKANTESYFRLNIDPINAEHVEKAGWSTRTHKAMNTDHWTYFITSELGGIVGVSHQFCLAVDLLSSPKSAFDSTRYRQYDPKKGTAPICL